MAAPKLYTASLVRAKNEMRKVNAEVDNNRKVRRDGCHDRLPSIEFGGRLAVCAREKSHGYWLAVMAGSHS